MCSNVFTSSIAVKTSAHRMEIRSMYGPNRARYRLWNEERPMLFIFRKERTKAEQKKRCENSRIPCQIGKCSARSGLNRLSGLCRFSILLHPRLLSFPSDCKAKLLQDKPASACPFGTLLPCDRLVDKHRP